MYTKDKNDNLLYFTVCLHQLFILKIHLFYSLQRNIRQPLFVFLWKLIGINRLAVFDDDMGFLYLGKMILKNITGVIQSNRDDGTAGFLGNFEASCMERQESVGNLVAGAFRENADRNAVLNFSNGG